jgi:hypothetical protein
MCSRAGFPGASHRFAPAPTLQCMLSFKSPAALQGPGGWGVCVSVCVWAHTQQPRGPLGVAVPLARQTIGGRRARVLLVAQAPCRGPAAQRTASEGQAGGGATGTRGGRHSCRAWSGAAESRRRRPRRLPVPPSDSGPGPPSGGRLSDSESGGPEVASATNRRGAGGGGPRRGGLQVHPELASPPARQRRAPWPLGPSGLFARQAQDELLAPTVNDVV